MSSGIVVNPECFEKFQLLAEKKESLRYIIYKIQGHEIAVEAVVTDNQVIFFRPILKNHSHMFQ